MLDVGCCMWLLIRNLLLRLSLNMHVSIWVFCVHYRLGACHPITRMMQNMENQVHLNTQLLLGCLCSVT